jgi:hypothetical protein
MGCQIGQRTIVIEPMSCSDWNAVKFGDNCVVGGFLQFHTFENMMLKVKQTHIQDGCRHRHHGDGRRGRERIRLSCRCPWSSRMNMLTATYEAPAEPVAIDPIACDDEAAGI